LPARKLGGLIAFLLALLSPIEAYSGVYLFSPGKWRDGKITWRYNPAGIAPGADEAAILATVQGAFDAWSAVCNITAEYAGTTTTSLSQTSARSEVVLGYEALPYPQAADAAADSEDAASNYTYFTSGKIRISTSIGANIHTDAVGTQQVYVIALYRNAVYLRTAQGWSGAIAALFNFSAPGAANFDILRDVDVRGLPAGTALYIGYGTSIDEMIARQQFKLVRVF
jgi:hypothetical protein